MKKYFLSIVAVTVAMLFSGCHAIVYGHETVHVRPHRVVYHTTHHVRVRRPARVYHKRYYPTYRRRPPVVVRKRVVVHRHHHRHVYKNRAKTKVYKHKRGKYKKYKKKRRR